MTPNYLPGTVSRFKAEINASVSSYSQKVKSVKTGKISQAVSSYTTQSNFGDYSYTRNIRRKIISTKTKLGSAIKKRTNFGRARVVKTDVYVYENVTPKLVELDVWAGSIVGQQMANAFERGIKYSVPKKYNNQNEKTWPGNSKFWKGYKQKNGFNTKPMHMREKRSDWGLGTMPGSKPLEQTVEDFGDIIKVVPTGRPNQYHVMGLEAEFMETPYVWFHESGYHVRGIFKGTYVPARPFIAPAMNEAMAYATGLAINRNPLHKSTKPISYKMGDAAMYEIKSKKHMQEFLMLIWWFMPQISEYKYLGYVHDALGYSSGFFITADTFKRFMTSLAVGKSSQMSGVPITSKLARRTSRKALWGTESVSVTGGG